MTLRTFDEDVIASSAEMITAFGELVTFVQLTSNMSQLYALAVQGHKSDSPLTLATLGVVAADQSLANDIEIEREITAIVTRNPNRGLGGSRTLNAPVFQVQVLNDGDDGISSDEIDRTRCFISMPPRIGQAASLRAVVQIINQDAGIMELECR